VEARRPERIRVALPDRQVETRCGDLMKPESLNSALERCTYVHSVAAMMGYIVYGPNSSHREAAMHVNVDGMVNVLRAAEANGAKCVIITSGWTTRYRPDGGLSGEYSPAISDLAVPDACVTSKVREDETVADLPKETGRRSSRSYPPI
jgi:nucleoside-diphosphate-sugar epimerase